MEKEGYEKVGEKQKLIGSRGKRGKKLKIKKEETRGDGKKQE